MCSEKGNGVDRRPRLYCYRLGMNQKTRAEAARLPQRLRGKAPTGVGKPGLSPAGGSGLWARHVTSGWPASSSKNKRLEPKAFLGLSQSQGPIVTGFATVLLFLSFQIQINTTLHNNNPQIAFLLRLLS